MGRMWLRRFWPWRETATTTWRRRRRRRGKSDDAVVTRKEKEEVAVAAAASTVTSTSTTAAAAAAAGSKGSPRGKKRTRSTDKKKKRGTTSLEAFSFEGDMDVDGNPSINNNNPAIDDMQSARIRDAHLIMATTQAINVLVSHLKDHSTDEPGQEAKHAALVLAALSHHLMTSLLNDKSMLESITKSSQYSASHSSSTGILSLGSGFWGGIGDEDAAMEGNDESMAGASRGHGRGSGARATTLASMTELAAQQKLERKRKMVVSYAKAVAGKAMTSCVMGALFALETLGHLSLEDEDESMVRDEGGGEQKVEYILLRRGVWTSLLALEMAFQFNNRPKLLMTSSVSMCSLGPTSSGGTTGSSYTAGMLDFDGVMSAVMGGLTASSASATGGTSAVNSSLSFIHTHMVMGANTTAMWNRFVQRIMFDYKLGFQQKEISTDNVEAENKLLTRICHATTNNVFSSEYDSKFISLVLKSEAGSPASQSLINEPPKKKAKRTPKTKAKPTKNESHDEELHVLSSLLAQRPENHVLFDCHVSVRRWSTLAFGWLCCGQRRFLETCMTMLTRKEGWKRVLEMATIETEKSTVTALDVGENPPTKKKKKDSKSKRSSFSKDADTSSPSERLNGLPGDLALVIFVSCMVDLISTGGISPSNSGWMDDYVKAITDISEPLADSHVVSTEIANPTNLSLENSEESRVRRSARTRSKAATAKASERAAAEASRTSPKGGKKPNAAWVRPNVTDEVAFLTKLLIDTHISCLQDSFRRYFLRHDSSSSSKEEHSEMKQLVVNDDDSYRDSSSHHRDNSVDFVNRIPFYPFMHRTLETLGRTAASSSFVSSSGVKSRILAIGGAIALSRFADHINAFQDENGVVVLDAKLISLVVTQLSETFDSLGRKNDSASNEGMSRENCDEKTTIDLLTKYRLNEPLVIERVEKKDGDSDPRATDAAVSYAGAFAQGREDLASHAEVLSCYIRAQLNLPYTGEVYLSGMISFLESLLSVIHMCYNFPTERQNETLDTTHPSVKKKKRKTDVVSGLSKTGLHETSAKTVTRCVLAADTLNFLRVCLAISPEWENSSSPTKETDVLWIRSLFRTVVSTNFIKKFVDLGYLLQDKLFYPRLLQNMNVTISSTPESSTVLFESSERRLWSSHVKLALTIGRGQAAYTGQCGESLLQESARRLEVYQHIANVEEERYARRPNRSPILLGRRYWPVFLPALQHALVASTLSCLPALPESSVQAEWFTCDAFLNKLEIVVRYLTPRSTAGCGVREPPLSLRDARLFILVAGKLDKDRQTAAFVRLIELLQIGLARSRAFLHDIHIIRLLARGVCLAAHVADLVTTHGLDMSLSREVASSHYNIPKIFKPTTPEEERSCSDKDIAFMGLFDDCKSPSVPAIGISSGKMMEEIHFEKMNELIKSLLEVGFKVCGQDGGHLLFSSWNAAAKLCSWTPMCWEGPSTAAIIKKQSVLDRLISLRDEMCEVFHLINKHEPSPHQQTLLVRATLSKKGHCRPNEALLTGITSCEKMIGHLASELNGGQVSAEAPSLQTFAYFEALPAYVSFLISMHTRPGSNNFLSIHRFSKSQYKRSKPFAGYTNKDGIDEFPSDDSDSEARDSGGQSPRTKALRRLHNACVTLGAAPCYPDWLDTSCRMQSEMVPPVAVDSADRALSSLTSFGVAVFKRYCQAFQDALHIASHTSLREPSPISSQLLHQLLVSHQFTLSGSEHESFYSNLSSISQTDVATLKFVVSNNYSLPRNSFFTHSSQRVTGAESFTGPEPNISELRANEQWEMIISHAIQGATLQIISSPLSLDELSPLVSALEVASRWKRVLASVVSAMVPTAALLRFAVYDGKGRNPHPLCNDLPESTLSSETIVTSRFSTNNEVGLNMKRALSFLSCIAAFSTEEDPLRLTCQAAANHMLETTTQMHFNDMVALWTVRVSADALQGLLDMLNAEIVLESTSTAAYALVEAIIKHISSTHKSKNVPESASGHSKVLNTLLSSCGVEGILQTRLIGDQARVELTSIISAENAYCPVITQRTGLAKLILFLIAGKEHNTQGLRSLVAEALCNLMDHEANLLEGNRDCNCTFRLAAATALDEMSRDDILLLMDTIFPTPALKEKEVALRLVKILITLATVEHKSISGKGCKMILSAMTECIGQWACSCVLSSATNLMCILASRFGTLQQIGSSILALALHEDDNSNLTHCIQAFFQFVMELEKAVHPGLVKEPPSNVSSQREHSKSKKGINCRTCTFTQTGEGFADQHWYNCYTCGLLWDKGCCSLCAKVCHHGHDVGYSRKSSFFCDCGAGVASGTRLKCKCLNPIDDKTFHALQDDLVDSIEESMPPECISPAEMVFKSFPAECVESLQLLVNEAKASTWNKTILDLFKKSFNSKPGTFDFSTFFRDPPVISVNDDGKPSLDLRCGVPLNLKCLGDSPSLVPIRAAKANSLKVGILPSLSANPSRRTRTERQFIDTDIRGRMVCAESNSILFLNAIPSVNIRNVENPYSSHLSRSQLCLLGTEKLKFDLIHGLSLSPDGQKLVVWGASEACVGLLSKGFDSFECTISLSLQLEAEPSECESEYLLGMLWLTDTILVCTCGTVIHVFDLATTDSNDSCKATAHYAFAYEDVLVRSAVLTSNLSCSNGVHKKLAILLDSGRLHFIDLYVDSDGALEDEGETYIEVGSGTTFPSTGIRRYFGGEPTSAGSTSTTLGEGCALHFLSRSNLLIYQCVSSPCVAMLIDEKGAINGTFELLPSSISSDNLPGSNFGRRYWSLFTLPRDGYRPKRRRDFLQSNMYRKKYRLESAKNTPFRVQPSLSFCQRVTLAAEFLCWLSQTEVSERAFVTLLTSNGSMLWFGEDYDGPARNETDLSKKVGGSPDIFMFEDPSIINVTENDRLVFAGDCAGKDSKTTKKKLSLNNNEFVMSPSRDGCTLTARLESDGLRKGSNDSYVENLAIVAVRILVGSMPDLIPREISIMGSGRTIKTRRNMKRWYDFVLTDEEILLSVRNGSVSINFSSSHDLSSGSIVDAVEIYAKNRSELHFLTLNSESSFAPKNSFKIKWHGKCEQENQSHISYIQSLLFLAKVVGEDTTKFLNSSGRDIMKQILEVTALDSNENEPKGETLRSSTLNLLNEVEHDASERSLFIDKSTLCGLMAALMGLGSFMKKELSSISASMPFPRQETVIHHVIDMLVHIIKTSACIAKSNGANYKTAILSLINDGVSKASLGIESKKVLDYAAHLSLLYGSPVSFVQATYCMSDLILKEIGCSDSDDFAHFDSLSEYLLHEDSSIVEACCKSIMANAIDAPKPPEEKSTQENPNGYVTYQCDACKIFPIKEMRYTIGGEVDIDLCKDCFERGCIYATSHEPGSPLVIHGRTLCVEGDDMPCDSIWQMKGITIAPPIAGFPMVEDVEAALKMSQTTKQYTTCVGVVDREEFRAKIFSSLLHLLSRSFDSKDATPSHHLIQLVLGVIHGSRSEKLKIDRGLEMLKTMTDSLTGLLDADVVNNGKIVMCLRTLSSLVMKKTSIDQAPSLPAVRGTRGKEKDSRGHHHKDKTDPRFVCDTHKIPAVRRRCSHGVHKDRRFYVCGLERKNRCNYFKWADTPNGNSLDKQCDPEGQHAHNTYDLNQETFEPIRSELTKMLGEGKEGSSSIQLQFCDLINNQFELFKDSFTEAESKDSGITSSASRPKFITRNTDDLKQDIRDGVLKSRRKLGKMGYLSTVKSSRLQSESSSDTLSLISESLLLFSLVASSQKWGSNWFPVLCAIISTCGSSALRQLAKKFLQQLCGGRQDVYHRVRDHYVYGYQFRKLLVQSTVVLDNALIAREMARQCGVNWRDNEVEFRSLPPAGLFGVGDLISEDCYSVSYEQNVQIILDELLSTASTHARRDNWRNFCALSRIPADAHDKATTRSRASSNETSILEQLVHRPPIMSALWLSSCLRGCNQVKMLKLADIALTDIKAEETSSSTDEDDVKIGGGLLHDCGQISPEQRLSNLTINDLHAFIVEFIVNGRNEELRCVAGNVVAKLASTFSDTDKNTLFRKLIGGLLRNVVGKFGCASKEFIELLKYFVQNFALDLSEVSSCITTSCVLQMTTSNHSAAKRSWAIDKEITRFDLANCVHCHRHCTGKKSCNEPCVSKGHEVWIDEQLRPCVKSRLESSTLASASSEYSSYIQLKFRVVLSEVFVTVSDPRGRLVKNIGIYFSPRPFGDVNMLKNDKYSYVWQRCGTLSLARHATSASFKLKNPVVAANLKFTYEDFYEKLGGGTRAPDGSFVLHCPRCTRQVNNAHGVCGNCGEVAFQCRKCRHINYDRLDAFLCVECGYCTSGGFSYDVSIGMALNAVAILDEDGYQRCISMLKIASKRHSELFNSLKKKMLVFSQEQSKLNGQDERIEEMVLYGPHLKRAFLGRLPKTNDESDAKPVSSPQSSSVSNRQGDSNRSLVANRARSLISLARQFRAEGSALGGDSERLSRSEFLIQQALLNSGSAGASDVLDELSETVFGALATGSSADNAFSRAIACLNERSPARTSRAEGGGGPAENAVREGGKDAKKPSTTEECSRIYSQMREAEHECFELTRRIEAWNRLNRDALATTGPQSPFKAPFLFQPTSCCDCSPQMSLALMSLLSAVFEMNIRQSEHTVTRDLIKLLLTESESMSNELKSTKRQMLITLASNSKVASEFILHELETRLTAVRDVISAEVLGQIVQLDFPSVEKYINLAISVLQENAT
eukprot:CCRYP_008325-RE/>CCRYP_008325-RE protein AED:0.09 eAED:0.09 QI:596/0.96/0.92/1/1/0.92/26/363/4715